MDFKKLGKVSDDEIIFLWGGEEYVCKNKIDPLTCTFVIVYGGLNACGKCKNFVRVEDKNNLKNK